MTANTVEALLEQDVIRNNRRLILTRWVAGVGLLLATGISLLFEQIDLPMQGLYGLGVFILGYNALLDWRSRQTREVEPIRQLILGQIALDWVSLTLFLWLTGGITSPALSFFVLHAIMVTILLPGFWPYVYLAMVLGAVLGIATLENAGWLHHHHVMSVLPLSLYQQEVFIIAQGAFFGVALVAVIIITGSIMEPLRQREQQLRAIYQTTKAVSASLDLPQVLANLAERACIALDARGASIRLLDASTRHLDLAAAYGSGYFTQDRITIMVGSPHQRAMQGTVTVVNPETMPDYPPELIQQNVRTVILTPISGARQLGLLSIYFDGVQQVQWQTRQFTLAIADQGVAAIQNALAHDALQKAEKQREQFVHIVTHELRSPVVGAQSLIGVMLKNLTGTLTDQQRDIIQRLSKRMDALLSLINDLLAHAATKADQLQQPLQGVDLAAILSHIQEQYRYSAQDKELGLSVEVPSEPLHIWATEDGMTRVMDNLVGNAVKYTPEGGEVRVCYTPNDDHVVLTIADTGIGIPPDSLDNLGNEFFRATNAKSSGITGTGLGLATVKQTLSYFGGSMDVQSVVDEGTTFTLTLPRYDGEDSPQPSPTN